MQHAIGVRWPIRFRDGSSTRTGCWQEMAEAEKKPQRICFRQVASRSIPLRNKFLGVIVWPERRLQLGEGVVIKAEIRGDELLFQNGGAGEERHGRPFRKIPGNQQDFPFALK